MRLSDGNHQQIKQCTSFPHYPKSNGKAENAVRSAKGLTKRAKKDETEGYLVFLAYRNTPTQGLDTTPTQRLMSRRTKTLLPTTPVLLQPEVAEHQHSKLLANQRRQAHYYNHGAKQLTCGVNVSRTQQN